MSDAHEAGEPRKPRIALMGEFSAGKSTLSNLLLGARPLPESVTATCLAPVWISQGPAGAVREHLDGTQTPVAMADLHRVPLDDTRVIRLNFDSDLLSECDLIDCPGISDPNMPSEVWERIMPEFDAVLWCTHATQAWRQSEAAVWDSFPEEVRARSILLVTRFDKLTEERDRLRVLARVKRETRGKFGALFPISLTQALAAGDNAEAWEASGAHHFAEHLMELIAELQGRFQPDTPVVPNRPVVPQQVTPRARPEMKAAATDFAALDEVAAEGGGSIFDLSNDAPKPAAKMPSRPAAKPARRPRPTAETEAATPAPTLAQAEKAAAPQRPAEPAAKAAPPPPPPPPDAIAGDLVAAEEALAGPMNASVLTRAVSKAGARPVAKAKAPAQAKAQAQAQAQPQAAAQAQTKAKAPAAPAPATPPSRSARPPQAPMAHAMPERIEDQPAPGADLPAELGPATAPKKHDAIGDRVITPRRVRMSDAPRTERPQRERPKSQKKSLAFGAVEPTMNDLRNAFSGE